jgi:hypothetical protein
MADRQSEVGHLPLLDVAFMLAASKRMSWRKGTMALAEATANVFTDEGLAAVDLRARFGEQRERFRVTLGELTVEGFAFAHTAEGYDRFLGKTDRWTTERTVEKLEAALRKELVESRRGERAAESDAKAPRGRGG